MKILIVCPYLPFPENFGGAIRTFNLLKRLSCNHEIDLIVISNIFALDEYIDEIKKYCKNVFIVSLNEKPKIIKLLDLLKRILRREPFLNKFVDSNEFEKLIYKVTGDKSYDLLQFEHSHTARNLKYIHPKQKAKTVLMMHNVTAIQFYRMFKSEKNMSKKIKLFLTWFPMLSWEPKIASEFDKTIVTSKVDKILLQILKPGLDTAVVPNGIDINLYRSYQMKRQKEKNILFVGSMDYEPNADAVLYFYCEIYPAIIKKIPECTLTIVGKNPPNDILSLIIDPKVKVYANVKEVNSYYEKASLSVVPLQSGGGTRLKILESMSFGVPIVSTSIGCEGLEIKNGYNILIGNTASDFSNKVLEILMSPNLAKKLSINARKLIEEKYNWDRITGSLENMYEKLIKVDDLKSDL
ncbi:glycosyltransferase family 4 protein [Calditrichota bacterium]